jgi:photosystem II stability/assembly factor-like uncharacterized protein
VAALAVVAVVVLAALNHHRAAAPVAPAVHTLPTVRSVPSPASLMPAGGMRGSVLIQGAASASASRVLVYFGSGPGVTTREWRAETTDGGATWHVARASGNLTMFAFAGLDGWAEGLRPDRTASFFASHDGGRTWHVASSDAPAPGGVGDVSVAGGEVWSLGEGCCADTVLRARASSDHLAATAAQPPLSNSTNVSVIAAARDSAYVLTNGTGALPDARLFGTHDAGRTWRSLPAPCPQHSFSRLYRGDAATVWATCEPTRGGTELRRSTDGGAHWTTPVAQPSAIEQLQPVSAQIVWAVAAGGRVMRTSDGGRTWSQVWYGGHPEPATLAGNTPPGLNRSWGTVLSVQSPATATVIVSVTRGSGRARRTNFVTYRTTDGGRTWRPSAVRLPTG